MSWLRGSAVRVSSLRPKGPRFNSQPMCYQVTTLGMLFSPTCFCRCRWSSGWCRLVTFKFWVWFSLPSFASDFEQVAILLCAQANSASYPLWDGKLVVAYGLWGEGLMWLIGAVVCLLVANHESNCSVMRAMDGRIVCLLSFAYAHQLPLPRL